MTKAVGQSDIPAETKARLSLENTALKQGKRTLQDRLHTAHLLMKKAYAAKAEERKENQRLREALEQITYTPAESYSFELYKTHVITLAKDALNAAKGGE